MNEPISYQVILFKAVSYALKAEKILKAKDIPHKLIPVPKQISSDCGVCLRFESSFKNDVQDALSGDVEFEDIRSL